MKLAAGTRSAKRSAGQASSSVASMLSARVIGQSPALEAIVPYVDMFQAGLSPEGRPAGVFLLLGPTGTGKTHTVEALADVLHGSEKCLLRVDCGEFQLEHEVAKLIGAPPGYLGHRETQPLLTQQRLNMAASEKCGLSLVLFDEIDKAAPSLARLLLGVLDKGTLRLGDNAVVNFERSLVFLTSNLGARAMMREIRPDFGFEAGAPRSCSALGRKLANIGMEAVKRKFSPEFVNRIDQVITYRPLDDESLSRILDRHISDFQRHVNARLGTNGFGIDVPAKTRRFLLLKGTSAEYGARELKRTLLRHITHPLAALVAGGRIEPGATVRLEIDEDADDVCIRY